MLLNQKYNLSLHVINPLEKLIINQLVKFPCYFDNQEEILKAQLIKNNHLGFNLFSNLKQIDYILILKGENAAKLFNTIAETIKSIENIDLITILKEEKLKQIKSYIVDG